MRLVGVSIACILTICAIVNAQVPIPLRPSGYGIAGPADAKVVVESFLDLACSDSQVVWPTILRLIKEYQERVHFRIHAFPLPYFANAFYAALGMNVIANATNYNMSAVQHYVGSMFENQHMWVNRATQNLTSIQVIDRLGSFVETLGLTSKADFLAGMTSSTFNIKTRVAWKYGCSRGIAETPTFLINGVAVIQASSWSFSDWQSVLDSLLGNAN